MKTPPERSSAWVFDPRRLLPGDIVLERSESKSSTVITKVDGGSFSHALLWLDGTDFIEAMAGGSRTISFARVVVQDPSRWRVLRYVGAGKLSRLVANQAAIEARGLTFKPYNLKGAVASVTPLPVRSATHLFCSELVAEAFMRAGAQVVKGLEPHLVTPGALERSSSLVTIVPLPLIPADRAPADRSQGYVDTGMNRENQLSQAAYAAVASDLEVLRATAGALHWPPGNLGDLIDLFALCDPIPGAALAARVHAVLEEGGYYTLLGADLKDDVISRAPMANDITVAGWRNSFLRASHNAAQSAAVAQARPWPLWKALAKMHGENAAFFADLLATASASGRAELAGEADGY